MWHYVLIRASYNPKHWTLAENKRRLQALERITVWSLLSQDYTEIEWRVAIVLHKDDPLFKEREACFDYLSKSQPFQVIVDEADHKDRVDAAYQTYQEVPWVETLGLDRKHCLTTRLDDDDALAVTALSEVQQAALGLNETTAIIHPRGVRVWEDRYSLVQHNSNAMHSLLSVAGDPTFVYSYGHTKVRELFPVVDLNSNWGWLWVRHQDTLSGHKNASQKIDNAREALEEAFWVDWDFIRNEL